LPHVRQESANRHRRQAPAARIDFVAGREIVTVGHSTHELERFVALLRAQRVEALADVRRHPSSRRLPHFNAGPLGEALGDAGIEYAGLGEELGGRRRPVPDSPNRGWRVAQFQGYADHMASPEFAAGLARLEKLARERRTAYMCAEGDWRRCHRRLISDALLGRGWRVSHLLRDGGLEAHELTPFAVVEGDRVSYPPVQPRLGD
jgi:uncharacterized protein (DUF488 family)